MASSRRPEFCIALHHLKLSYDDIEVSASQSPPGSNSLFFLPYLSGERVAQKPNSRAQYFGLKAEHTMHDLHRAVLEGVAFSVRLKLDHLAPGKAKPSRIVAASGGAKSNLWLKIKSSMYNAPYIMTKEAECGVIGIPAFSAIFTTFKVLFIPPIYIMSGCKISTAFISIIFCHTIKSQSCSPPVTSN